MNHEDKFSKLFMTPLYMRTIAVFQHNSDMDNFIPFQKHRELLQWLEQQNPDALLRAVAEGADAACNAYSRVVGSGTNRAIEQLLDQATQDANALRRPWQTLVQSMRTAPITGSIKGTKAVAGMLFRGKLTIGNVLKDILTDSIKEFFHPVETRKAAMEATAFFSAFERFQWNVETNLERGVLPAFARDLG